MMKLTRPPEPLELIQNRKALTDEYLNSKKPVWRKDYIISPLFSSSYGKCAYCNCKIEWSNGRHDYYIELDEANQPNFDSLPQGENNLLHIDHFIARKFDENKVVEWNNLIPSCPKCNYKKSVFDVSKNPIINPYDDDPRNFFRYTSTLTVIPSIDNPCKKKACRTIAVFGLVDRLGRVLRAYQQSIEDIFFKFFKDIENALISFDRGDPSQFNGLKDELIKLFGYGLPESPYSSFLATMILRHEYYEAIKTKLVETNLWSNQLQNLEIQLKEISYE